MKKKLKYLSIFLGCFILLIIILFVIIIFYFAYKDNTLSDSDFSEYDIAISSNDSNKREIIDIMDDYISNKYNLPLYLKWAMIDISNSEGKISKKFMRCSFKTYKKESNEYGHILVTIDLLDMNFFSLYATFGDDIDSASLKEDKKIRSNLEDLDNILDAASAKMKQRFKEKEKYEYGLDFNKNIVLYNSVDNMEYTYDSKKRIFTRNKES